MFLAEGEGPERFYFFIAIAVIMALRHFFEKAKAKGADRIEQSRTVEADDGDEWYDADMQSQGYNDPNPGNETLLEFFRNVNQQKVPPPVPPPPPQVQVPSPRREAPPATPQRAASSSTLRLTREEQRALERVKKGASNLGSGRTRRQRTQSSSQHSELGKMLRDPAHLRNAFILKEILDPPVTLRDEQEQR